MVDSISSNTNSTAGAGSKIVAALGSGSGIDSNTIVSTLVDISKMADSNRLTARKTLLESQISDFGLLRSSFSKLEAAASLLGNADTFNAKSVAVPTTTLLGVTKLDAKASVGDYSIKVDAIAQAQSLKSGDFSSVSTPIGKGTLTIRFGAWSNVPVVLPDDPPLLLQTFVPDATKTGGIITIDDSNNSLTGLRDTINKSGMGLKASIVNNAGVFNLVVTGPSGATNEIEITATAALTSFNVNNTTKSLTQLQEGKDSLVHVNGMPITRSSNHLTDVIEGLEFDLFNSSTSETINLGISADKSVSEKAIRDFVAAYNTFLKESKDLVGFNSEKNAFGSLKQDPLAKNLLDQVRHQLSASVAGVSSSFTALSNLGIGTNTKTLDGSLIIDDSTATTSFRSAIDNNFEAVRDLFIPKVASNNAQIIVSKFGANSTAGSYDVVITTQPSKGQFIAAGTVSAFPFNTTNNTFTVAVDGINAAAITLPAMSFTSGDELATDLQTRINADTNLVAAKVSLSVAYNSGTNKLEFTSNAFGASSNVSFSNTSNMADLGISDGAGTVLGTAGADVAGTVGGVAANGFGDILLPALNSKAEGLSMRIVPGATTGAITFSRGFAGTFTRLVDDFLKTSGLIKNRGKNITKDVDKIKTDQKTLERRGESYRARLQAQFSAMESIVRGLKTTGTFLTGAFKALSGDSNN